MLMVGKREAPMQPAPSPKKSDVEEQIDDAIAAIDKALPKIHRRAAAAKSDDAPPALTPVPGAGQAHFMRSQQALSKLAQEMKDSDTFTALDVTELRKSERLKQQRQLKKA
jgi:hypothetical protein